MEVLGVGSDTVTYNAIMDETVMSDELKSVKNIVDKNGEMDVELLAFDSKNYERIEINGFRKQNIIEDIRMDTM